MELITFCNDEGLVISDVKHLDSREKPYIFISNHSTTSWLGHVISTHSGHGIIGMENRKIKYTSLKVLTLLSIQSTSLAFGFQLSMDFRYMPYSGTLIIVHLMLSLSN